MLLLEILLAAYRAAGDFLFLRSQEKEAKEWNPLPASLRAAPGNLRCSITGWGRRTRYALGKRCAHTTAASQITVQMRPSAHLPTLRSARLGTGRKGALSTWRAQALRPTLVEVLHFSGGCLNAALQARSEFRRRAVGRRASWVTFLSRTRKLLARRGELPASAVNDTTPLRHRKKIATTAF